MTLPYIKGGKRKRGRVKGEERKKRAKLQDEMRWKTKIPYNRNIYKTHNTHIHIN
jgi:hypothetical protein